MAAELKFSYFFNLFRALMYLAGGLAIIFVPFPLFKEGSNIKVILGILCIVYSGFRVYQIILQRKRQSNEQD